MSKDNGKASSGGYIFRSCVIRKDGTVIRPKKAKALRIPIAKLKNRKA